ncbi:MAG TPA: DUF3750 domain-containing protein [Pseudolabrys sp.]|nr:DUF3750 domain-containing protein [Pseudolabrys sp.]
MSRFFSRKVIMFTFLAVFLLPIVARAAFYAASDGPRSWRDADWSSIGSLPPANEEKEARVIIFSGRTGGWKGVVAVHSWVVLKAENAAAWTRYDVVGWGNPLRVNAWAPDGRWFGDRPRVVADVRGAEAAALIPRLETAVRSYEYRHAGDYRIWPGPNSNSFTAALIRAAPELQVALPSNAIGRDFRDGFYLGPTDSHTGVEINLWGYCGIKLGWVEGIEINMFGLVAGLDLRHPGVKLPGYGRIGV